MTTISTGTQNPSRNTRTAGETAAETPDLVCRQPSTWHPEGDTGTREGYQRHRFTGQPPCAACRAGWQEYLDNLIRRSRDAEASGDRYTKVKLGMRWAVLNHDHSRCSCRRPVVSKAAAGAERDRGVLR